MNCSRYRPGSQGQKTSDAYISMSAGSMSSALRTESICQSAGQPNDRSALSCHRSFPFSPAWKVSMAKVAMHSSTHGQDR